VMGMSKLLSPRGSMRKHSTTFRRKVSLTNLCDQLIVTSILRMQSDFRAAGLSPFGPRRTI
jgi:hypothetical protein